MKKKNIWQKIITWPAFPALALLIVFLVLNQFLSPGYLSGSFISSFLSANAPMIIVSLGVSVILIGGGMDISMGGLLCLPAGRNGRRGNQRTVCGGVQSDTSSYDIRNVIYLRRTGPMDYA